MKRISFNKKRLVSFVIGCFVSIQGWNVSADSDFVRVVVFDINSKTLKDVQLEESPRIHIKKMTAKKILPAVSTSFRNKKELDSNTPFSKEFLLRFYSTKTDYSDWKYNKKGLIQSTEEAPSSIFQVYDPDTFNRNLDIHRVLVNAQFGDSIEYSEDISIHYPDGLIVNYIYETHKRPMVNGPMKGTHYFEIKTSDDVFELPLNFHKANPQAEDVYESKEQNGYKFSRAPNLKIMVEKLPR